MLPYPPGNQHRDDGLYRTGIFLVFTAQSKIKNLKIIDLTLHAWTCIRFRKTAFAGTGVL